MTYKNRTFTKNRTVNSILALFLVLLTKVSFAVPIEIVEDGIILEAGETFEFEFDGFLSSGLFIESNVTALTDSELLFQEVFTIDGGPDLVIDELLGLSAGESWEQEEYFEGIPATSDSLVITNVGFDTAVFNLFAFRDSILGGGDGDDEDEDECDDECGDSDDYTEVPEPNTLLLIGLGLFGLGLHRRLT